MAARRIASAPLAAFRVSWGSGGQRHQSQHPQKVCLLDYNQSQFWEQRLQNLSPAAMISGPIPSPASVTIFFVMFISS